MIAIADHLSATYPDMKTLAASLVSALGIEMKARGWTGVKILDADYCDQEPPASLLIVIGPGHEELSVPAVRTFVRKKRLTAKEKS
jgi:hypothetical protein